MNYTIQISVSGDFDEVVDTAIATLEDGGFGVLSTVSNELGTMTEA